MRLAPVALAAFLVFAVRPAQAESAWRTMPVPPESERLTQEAGQAGTPLDAARLYAKAIRICPSNGPALFGLGGVLLRQDRPEDGLKAFHRMNRLFPDDPEIALAIATTLTRLPDLNRAKLQEGIGIAGDTLLLHPGEPELWHHLSILRHLNGDYAQAAEAARQAIALDAQDPIDPETTARYQQQEAACNDALLVFSPLD